MSKKISYKGTLSIGTQDKITLKTNRGKVGYKITKFQLMPTKPGTTTHEYVGQIFSKDQTGSITQEVKFTNNELLAVIYYADSSSAADNQADTIIFDNAKFNQNIFINITDASGNTDPCNYYIELETMKLTDIEATMLTLKSIKTMKS